jgi:hypothetical protein
VAAVLAELLAAEGAVAGDLNDRSYGLLFCLFWDAFGLFGHSDGVFVSMVSTFDKGRETVGLYICDLTRAFYMNENLHSTL